MAYFTANGSTDEAHGVLVEGRVWSLAPEQANVAVKTIGRVGAWPARTDTGPSQLSLNVRFVGSSLIDAEAIRADVAAWLVSPVDYQITFADLDGRYWLGKLSGTAPLTFVGSMRKATLVFDLFSPYLYGADVTQAIADGTNVIPYAGTAPTDPVITLVPDADVGFVAVTCVETGESVTVGSPETYDDAVPSGMTPLLSVSGADVPTASNMTYVDAGTVAGTLVSNGYSLSPGWPGGSYSAGADKHGPGRVWPLSAAATDFRAEAVLAWIDSTRGMGRVELYLYDSAADFSATHIIGKVALKDTTISAIATYFEARAGTLATGHTIKSTHSKYWDSGKIRIGIGRENHRWTCDIGVWNVAGRWSSRFDAAFTELSGFETYGKTVAAVGLHIGQYAAYPVVAQQACYSIAVSGIGMAGAAALIPANSEVVMDMRNGAATIDGTDVRALLDPQSRPFAIPVGGCSLLVETTGGDADSVELVTQKTGTTEFVLSDQHSNRQTVPLVAGQRIVGLTLKGHRHGTEQIVVLLCNPASDIVSTVDTTGMPMTTSAEFVAALTGAYVVPASGLYSIYMAAVGAGSPVLLKSTTNPYAGGALDGTGSDLYFAVLGAPAAIFGTLAYTERDL